MAAAHLLHRLHLNGHTGIAYYGIHLLSRVGTPVSQAFGTLRIREPSPQFLYQQVLKGMAILHRAAHQFTAMAQVIGHAHIEIVKTGSLHQPALHHPGKCRQAKA